MTPSTTREVSALCCSKAPGQGLLLVAMALAAFAELPAETGARYLIIANDTLVPAIRPLADWKTQKGMLAKVVPLSQITNDPDSIRNYIRNAYWNWQIKPEYVLIVGAPDLFPPSRWSPFSIDDGYGDMTGDYEVELPVGRFFAETPRECSTLVAKTLLYEQTPFPGGDSTWLLSGTTIVREDWPWDEFYQPDCRYIRALWDSAGFVESESLMDEWGDNSDTVRNSICHGRGFVLWRGQCVANWSSPFDEVSPSTLPNILRLPIVLTGSCQTVTLFPGQSMLGDQFVRAGTPQELRGAVAYFGTAFYGSHLSQYRGLAVRSFFRALFDEGNWRLGDACRRAKFAIDSVFHDQTRYQEWTLLGDPELNVWTGRPRPLAVTCDSQLLIWRDTLQITVRREGQLLAGALVCARDTTGIYRYGCTDASGQLAFDLSLVRDGFLQVTVTAHNSLPRIDTVRVRTPDFGVRAIAAPTGQVDSGAAITPQAVVRNYGSARVGGEVAFRSDDGYQSAVTVLLAPGAEDTFSFAPWTPLIRGRRTIKCSTRLARDADHRNDTLSASVLVQAHDVSVTNIMAPSGTIDSGSTAPPWVRIHNFGNVAESVPVSFLTEDGYASTVVKGMGPGGDSWVWFPVWTARGRGRQTLRCTTALASDGNPANDLKTCDVTVAVHDAGVIRILSPDGVIVPGPVQPEVLLRNCGTAREPLSVSLTIRSQPHYRSVVTLPGGLPPGNDTAIDFANWTAAVGSFTARCSVCQANDQVRANDIVSGSFRVRSFGWIARASLPVGASNKGVKDGGALAYVARPERVGENGKTQGPGPGAFDPTPCGDIYALKGNNTREFLCCDLAADTWTSADPIPGVGSSQKLRQVKKGAALTALSGIIYAVKGNRTNDFFRYDPDAYEFPQWSNLPAVPGAAVKEGASLVGIPPSGIGADTLGSIYLLKASTTTEFLRYDLASERWESRASVPAGVSGRNFKNGSCIAFDGAFIYALRANYDDFFVYDMARDTWSVLPGLPLVGRGNRKKRVKDGAGLAVLQGTVYGLKGGNTRELWGYRAGVWSQVEDLPLGGGRNVRAGGALVATEGELYALKGNGTLEFYAYGPSDAALQTTPSDRRDATQTGSLRQTYCSLSVSPNPADGAASVSYSIAKPGNVNLKLFDVTGKLIAVYADGQEVAGSHRLPLDAVSGWRSAAPGVLLLRLEADGATVTRKLMKVD